MFRRVGQAALALCLTCCTYAIDGAARAPEPPDGVVHLAAIDTKPDGTVRWTTPLRLRSDDRPFDGDIVTGADGDTLWLVGYSAAQIDACTAADGVDITSEILVETEGTVLDLPAPVWSAGGPWADGTATLADARFDVPLSSRWLDEGVRSCSVWSHEERTIPLEGGSPNFSVTYESDGVIRFFLDNGRIIDVDPASETATAVVSSTSAVSYIGGFLDDREQAWVFANDGRLDRLVRGQAAETIRVDGPWDDANRVWADGVAVGDGVEIFFHVSTGDYWHYVDGRIEKLVDILVPPILNEIRRARVLRRDDGEVWFVTEGAEELFRWEDGRIFTEQIGDLKLGSPVFLLESERYGMLASTNKGYVLRRSAAFDWRVLMPAIAGRAVIRMFDWNNGILVSTSLGQYEFFAPGLERCDLIEPEYRTGSDRVRVGNRMFVVTKTRLLIWDVETKPFGCGALPDLD